MIDMASDKEIILSGEFNSDDLEKIIDICMEDLEKFIIHFYINSEMTATIYVRNGVLEDAILGPYGGLQVLALLSDDVKGSFDLCPWQEPKSNSINLAVSSALLTAAVQFDENKYRLRQNISNTIEHIVHLENPFSLTGSLGKIKLEILLLFIESLNKNCKIELAISPEIKGEIYYSDKYIVDASLDKLRGIKAFGLILENARAEFSVIEYSNEVIKTIDLPIKDCMLAAKNIII